MHEGENEEDEDAMYEVKMVYLHWRTFILNFLTNMVYFIQLYYNY